MIEQMGKSRKKVAIKLDSCQGELRNLLMSYSEKISKANKKTLLGRLKRVISRTEKSNKGMYIFGGVGRGKTMLLKEFYDGIEGKKKLFVHFHKFMDDFHVQLNALNNDSKACSDNHVEVIASRVAKKYSVVILDELQINNISDAMIVGRLFECLIESGIFVFFSSNRPPDDLFKDGLQRERFLPFIDYIKQKLCIFELNNYKDYRLDILADLSDSYFAPMNDEKNKAFTELLSRIIGRHELEERVIRVGANRNLRVFRSYGNVAVFSFKELCEVSLGAKDYMALCANFMTIIIKDIPKMGRDNHNEALRFITLIDCMYNTNTSLICTAEAEPEHLYVSGRNSFEFQRTASRLNDMRAYEYRHVARENTA